MSALLSFHAPVPNVSNVPTGRSGAPFGTYDTVGTATPTKEWGR